MIKGDKAYLDQIAKTHVCSEHQTPVVVAWHDGENSYILRCGKGHFPEEVTRQLSLTQEYKADEEIPEPIKGNIEKGMRRRAMQQGKQSTAVTFQGVPATDLATGELLLPEVIQALVEYAHKYQLDPARSHVVLMYSKPYITIDGYLFHAHRQHIPFTISSHPLDIAEKGKYQIPDEAHAWLCEVRITEGAQSFTGLGVVTKDEMTATSKGKPEQLRSPVVARYPWLLAQKRAEWQALRRAFPIGESEEVKSEARD